MSDWIIRTGAPASEHLPGVRMDYFIRMSSGSSCSGHFINDVGATLPDCADWIVRYQLRLLPEDTSIRYWTVLLSVSDKPVYIRSYHDRLRQRLRRRHTIVFIARPARHHSACGPQVSRTRLRRHRATGRLRRCRL